MENNELFEAAGIRFLTIENSKILDENGFPVLILTENGEETRVGPVEAKRAFPFESEDEFIVLEDEKGADRGFIRSLADRSEGERAILGRALEMRYFMPKITKIEKVNDRYGFSYFKVETTSGPTEFTVRDPYKSIVQNGKRLIITDADGNRFEIPDVDALEKKDRKKIEQYLW